PVEGRTAVLLDRSGSMNGHMMRTAAIFAVSLMKKANLDGRLLAFDDRVDEIAVSMQGSVLTQASRIEARGGTNTALPMQRIVDERYVADNVLLITDEQQNAGMPFLDVLDAYRRKVNPAVRTFILDVAPYRSALTPPCARTFYLYGWSDQALSFVSMASRG